MNYLKLLVLIPIVAFISCDGGLEPEPPTFINLNIQFVEGAAAWPSPAENPDQDSIYDLRFVAFKSYPPQDILTELLSGNALFSESLPLFKDSIQFDFLIEEIPVDLKYLVIAWQYGENLTSDWRVAGVYTITGDVEEPGELNIDESGYYPVSIIVDWENLPPQPF